MDLRWRRAVPGRPGAAARDARRRAAATLDAQRFAQLGSWEGAIVDRRRGASPSTRPRGSASRDRSWGIRPVGESEPPGRPADPPFDGMWWLYVPIAFDGVRDRADHPGGARRLPRPQRLPPGCGRTAGSSSSAGRASQTNYVSGTRTPKNGVVTCTTPDGTPVTIEVESLLAVPIARRWRVRRRPGLGPRPVEGRRLRRAGHLRHERPRRGRPGAVRPDRQRRPGGLARGGQGARRGLGPLRARRHRPARAHRLHRLVHPRP